MRPDFHPNMQQGNFGRPPFNSDGPRPPMMRPPFDMPNQQQQPNHFGGGGIGGPPMNQYRHPHPRMADPMNQMGPRGGGGGGRPPFPGQQHHFGPNNFNHNRMNGPQQFPGPMPPYQQQPQPLPQRPTMMNNNRLPMMGGGGLAGMPPSGGGPPGVGGVPSVGMAALLPRKVLINPNFKGGGVEAATSELH